MEVAGSFATSRGSHSTITRPRRLVETLSKDAGAVLGTTALAGSVDAVLTEAWNRYYKLEPTLPIERTLGAVFTPHLAAATLAMHETLRRHGFPRRSRIASSTTSAGGCSQMGEPWLLLAGAFTIAEFFAKQAASELCVRTTIGLCCPTSAIPCCR